ncbi:MAG: serine hydrolase [Flavisolibacter sp.]|nr:serine hydrolase [Flavisolibacter sp.]
MITPYTELKTLTTFPKTDAFLSELLINKDAALDTVLKNPSKYKVQVIYTRVNRDSDNQPSFEHSYFGIDPDQYFYPASTVKFPVALLALQKINELNIPGLDEHATFITGASQPWQTETYNEPSSEDGRPTIAHYIKQILLVSDNEAFNRLYEFLGQQYINNSLHQMGYMETRILHRLQVSLTDDQNRITNPIKFYDTSGKLLYEQPQVQSSLQYNIDTILLGKGFMRNGKLVDKPFDFTIKNKLTLPDLHSMLQSIIFPSSVPQLQRFNLNEQQYKWLYKYMSMKPAESVYPSYDSTYTDAYVKFLMYGGSGSISDPGIRIFNKVGDAYGFLTDAAYIVDFKNGVEFLLSATVYTNENEIFNDDQYEYNTVGFPFMKKLGEVIYEYELNRQKKNIPDLTPFQISYLY